MYEKIFKNMLKKIIAIFFVFSLGLVSNSKAESLDTKISEYISNLIPGEGLTETSIKLNDKDEDQIKFSILGLRNILEEDNSNLFTQFSLRTKEVNSDGRIHGNLGIGYRKLSDDNSIMYGANTFIDADIFEGHRRLGYGLEAKASLLDLSLNRYQKITNMKTIDGTAEQILSGWDYYLTTQVPYTPWAKFSFKGYKWEGEKTSKDSRGNKYISELNINPSLQLNLSMDDSSISGVDDVLEAELLFVYPPRENIRTMNEGLSDVAFEKEDMQAKLNEKVRRNNDLTIEIQGSVIITSQ